MVGVRGGRRRTVVRRGKAVDGRAGTWSADGRRLVVGSWGRTDAHVLTTGRERRRRLRFAGEFVGATFSPDGRRLLVQRLRTELLSTSLVLIDLRHGGRREIRREQLPAWGPRALAWRVSDRDRGSEGTYAAIVLSRALTGARRELLRGAPSLGDPVAWSADGSRLLVPDHQADGTRAVLLESASGSSQTLPAPFDSGHPDRADVAGLSRDGRLVLGEAGGAVVAQDATGAVTVLANEAATPSWTR